MKIDNGEVEDSECSAKEDDTENWKYEINQ